MDKSGNYIEMALEGSISDNYENNCEMYTEGSIISSAAISVDEYGVENGVTAQAPNNPPPVYALQFYTKVRIKDPGNYKGEFGFDWIDVNADSGGIEKIQDVAFSEAEYFYKEPTNTIDLGDMLPIAGNEDLAKKAIKKKYAPSPVHATKYFDIPFVLMKKAPDPIELSLEIIPASDTIEEDEHVVLTGDEFYEFEIIGGEKEGKVTKKRLSSRNGEKVFFKIKCLQFSGNKQYDIKSKNGTVVGGFIMMENQTLKLEFRVIALVSSDGASVAKAKALFQKFKDSKIKEYLNENSLNQAGYEVELENQLMFNNLDTADLDDYFYAFDKENWTSKKYFARINKQKTDIDAATGRCRTESWNSVTNECAKILVPTDVIVDDQKVLGGPEAASVPNEMDNITISEYKNKLKTKDKSYEGGIIILSEFESSDKDTGAYSRTSPLNHYSLIVYSTNTASKDTYAHEIGHMLGLPHLFFDTKEKDSYKNARENILGNGTTNSKNVKGIKKSISDIIADNGEYYSYQGLTAIKESIIRQLKKYNEANNDEKITTEKNARNAKLAYYINYRDTDLVSTTQTKKKYFDTWKKNIQDREDGVKDNKKAIDSLQSRNGNNYEKTTFKMCFFRTDLIKLLNENLEYEMKVINQKHSNYLMFKQKSTENIMDYYNKKLRFLLNQIEIMRSDAQNYVDFPINNAQRTNNRQRVNNTQRTSNTQRAR